MPEIINRWFKKSPESKNALPPEDIAKIVRDRQLDIFNFGVLGSDVEVPDKHNSKATKLPNLLRYSPKVIKHMQAMIGIFSSPKAFEIETGKFYHDNLTADVLYCKEGQNHVFYFTHNTIQHYLNGLIMSNKSGEGYSDLIVSILQENERRAGKWIADYNFFDFSTDETFERSFPGGNLHPERQMLLSFWFSPKKLDGIYFLKNYPSSQIVKDHLSFTGEKKASGFRFFNFHYDSLSHADKEEKMPYIEDLAVRYSSFLRKKGNIDFSIVEIGIVTLDGVKHWIYTGSEQASIQVKEERKVGVSSLNPLTANE